MRQQDRLRGNRPPRGRAPATPPDLNVFVAAALRRARPRRVVGRQQSTVTHHVLTGEKPPCQRLARVLREELDAALATPGAEPLALLGVGHAINAWVREYVGVHVIPFPIACELEQRAHCAVDPLQIRALTTRSLGDFLALEQALVAQRETTDDLLASTRREISRLEAETAARVLPFPTSAAAAPTVSPSDGSAA